MKMLNNGLGADVSQHHAHQYSHHGLRRWGRATFGASHVYPNVQSKSTTTTTPRTGPWPWPSTRTGPTPVKDIKTASFLPPSQYHVWPTQTQTYHDPTSIPRQTTTAWSSGGCRARPAYRDSQSWVWDHQSHRGSSNQTCHQNWRKTSTRSGLRQTETLCGGIV